MHLPTKCQNISVLVSSKYLLIPDVIKLTTKEAFCYLHVICLKNKETEFHAGKQSEIEYIDVQKQGEGQ